MNDRYETGLYRYRPEAEAAVERLNALGYARDDISVVMDDKTREQAFAGEVGAKTGEGIATGSVAGGVLGAIVGAATATGSVAVIAGTGGLAAPFVVGPLVGALAGLGVGGAAGGIVGGLIGLGVGESRAKAYEKGIKEGGILIAVKPKSGHEEKLREALRDQYDTAYAGDTNRLN